MFDNMPVRPLKHWWQLRTCARCTFCATCGVRALQRNRSEVDLMAREGAGWGMKLFCKIATAQIKPVLYIPNFGLQALLCLPSTVGVGSFSGRNGFTSHPVWAGNCGPHMTNSWCCTVCVVWWKSNHAETDPTHLCVHMALQTLGTSGYLFLTQAFINLHYMIQRISLKSGS